VRVAEILLFVLTNVSSHVKYVVYIRCDLSKTALKTDEFHKSSLENESIVTSQRTNVAFPLSDTGRRLQLSLSFRFVGACCVSLEISRAHKIDKERGVTH
jgi:hypothetical protein